MIPFRFFTLLFANILLMLFVLMAQKAYAAAPLLAQTDKSHASQARPSHPPRVILNHPIVPDISEQFLREVFSGKVRHWPDGNPIKVVLLNPESRIHQSFIQRRLRMFPYQVERLWNKRIFSGRADPPIIVRNIDTMRSTVLSTPGAIGYLPFEQFKRVGPMQSYANVTARVIPFGPGH